MLVEFCSCPENLRRIPLMGQLIQFLDLGVALTYFTPEVFRVTHHDNH